MNNNKVVFEIEPSVQEEMKYALEYYEKNEIGGILIGYQIKKNHFKISKATIADDTTEFNISSFVREPFKSMKILLKLFQQRNHNYIGEWHSHPMFSLEPSSYDVATMKGILFDDRYNVKFALLIITKLHEDNILFSGYLFHKKIEKFLKADLFIY